MGSGLGVSIGVVATGFIGGPAITTFVLPDLAMWWWPALVRVLWLGIGSVMLISAIHREYPGKDEGIVRGYFYGFVLGAVILGFNPMVDLMSGPVRVHGHLVVDRYEYDDDRSNQVRVLGEDGSTLETIVMGSGEGGGGLAKCEDRDDVVVVALRNPGTLLSGTCP